MVFRRTTRTERGAPRSPAASTRSRSVTRGLIELCSGALPHSPVSVAALPRPCGLSGFHCHRRLVVPFMMIFVPNHHLYLWLLVPWPFCTGWSRQDEHEGRPETTPSNGAYRRSSSRVGEYPPCPWVRSLGMEALGCTRCLMFIGCFLLECVAELHEVERSGGGLALIRFSSGRADDRRRGLGHPPGHTES